MQNDNQKCLSIYQPAASLIAMGEKQTEQRTWDTLYRGELIICATSKEEKINGEYLPAGVAFCVVDLVGTRKIKAGYSWLLKNPRPIMPVPIKGRQRIFSPNKPIPIEFLPPDIDHVDFYQIWREEYHKIIK